MKTPTPEQTTAIRRLQIGLQRVYDATKRLNDLINEHNLETDFGINRLPYFHLGQTASSLVEPLRLAHAADQDERRAA